MEIQIFWKWVIRSIPGMLVGALMWASQVTPEQASSNIASWLMWLGVDRPPAWVTGRAIDNWVFWGGLVALLAWGAFLVVSYRNRQAAAKANESHISAKESKATLRIKCTDGAANRRYMRFEGDRVVCTWYLEIVNESDDIEVQDVEVKVESYDQIPDLLSPHTQTGAFTPVGIILAFERGGNTRSIRRHDSEWVKFLSFDRQTPRRWIQIGEYVQGPLDLHGKIMQLYTPHRIELTVRAANANPVVASFIVKAENEMLDVRML
jgi:hypothetical protein